jgi:four helix bundle protein
VSTFRAAEEIPAWQKARESTRRICGVAGKGRLGRDFALVDQMRGASASVTSSIAEGFERRGGKDFTHSRSVARGSLGELRARIDAASDQGGIDDAVFRPLSLLADETGRLPGGLARYLRQHKAAGDTE